MQKESTWAALNEGRERKIEVDTSYLSQLLPDSLDLEEPIAKQRQLTTNDY